MSLRKFAALPSALQNEAVRCEHRLLEERRGCLAAKRCFDIALSLVLLPAAALPMLLIAGAVVLDSPGPALFCQTRQGRYGRPFTMYKFRTMTVGGEGPLLTRRRDGRVTRVGEFLRRRRLDELPQLWNILRGELSFVGPRPEVGRYVARYDELMLATLLIPPGLTSPAALAFADEAELLDTEQAERVYVDLLLPRKAALNLRYLRELSPRTDLRVLLRTVGKLFGFKCRNWKYFT